MNLNLLSYNNYYNRIIKKFDTFAEYEPYVLGVIENINFNPGDGVDTIQIVNYDGATQPDYVIITGEKDEIISRWFIIDSDFVRRGQVKLQLFRDTIADNYEDVVDAPMFVEKATLKNTDPMIFNSEDMTFNEIKQEEVLLKDETQCPWIVGYIPYDAFKEATEINSSFIVTPKADIKVNKISDWEFYKYTSLAGAEQKKYVTNIEFKYRPEILYHMRYTQKQHYGPEKEYIIKQKGFFQFNSKGEMLYSNSGYDGGITVGEDPYTLRVDNGGSTPDNPDQYIDVYVNFDKTYPTGGNSSVTWGKSGWGGNNKGMMYTINNKLKTNIAAINQSAKDYLINSAHYDYKTADVLYLNGKTILDQANNTLYEVHVQKIDINDNLTNANSVFDTIKTYLAIASYNIKTDSPVITGSVTTSGRKYFSTTLTVKGKQYKIELQQKNINIKTTVLASNTRNHLGDAPYDMFCLPYGENFKVKKDGKVYESKSFACLNMAVQVAAQSGAGNVYDIQLLPYCPVRNAIMPDGSFDITGITHNEILSADGTQKYGFMIWCTQANFTFDINHQITIDNPKISNECDSYRLCSPNYNGLFEFSPAKNGGVTKFNVDCTYKPFNSYIHINPDFKGLYGKDFNDARGLIVGGDFSLTQLNSEWANYQLNNKNFQASFDKQIAYMDEKNNWQTASDTASAAAGVLAGVMGGGAMGFMKGGGKGAIAGMVGGGIASGLAGAADVGINRHLRDMEIQWTKDQFGFQLGNIKAIPYSLSKVSALTANNKLFPFLEKYSCTNEEKQALANKLKYNGMTVMRIGTMREFILPERSYIKGKLIRLEIDDDFHMINTIAEELNKGVFI